MTQTKAEKAMTIKVLYFASLRELLGCNEELISEDGLNTIGDVWQRVSDGKNVTQQVLYSINQEYAQAESLVKAGDEVAFFPPVTGG
ncbi:MAG: MoaD/ThiS family protein [Cycloclasticus sp.]|jgi:molybdopterin synthase sulfur carrier subunit